MLGAALALEKAQVLGSVFFKCAQAGDARSVIIESQSLCRVLVLLPSDGRDAVTYPRRPSSIYRYAFFVIHLSAS
jgi:hypothetical protein